VTVALYGSFLPIPSEDLFPLPSPPTGPLPGAVICLKTKIQLNVGRKRWFVEVKNAGDRPIQVGSHYLFLETNPSLIFDRLLAYGTRLDIPAGTAVRFEPGERKTVSLVQVGGNRLLSGGSGLGSGPFEESKRETTVKGLVEKGKFGHKKQERIEEAPVPEMDREVVSCPFFHLVASKNFLLKCPSTRQCSVPPQETGSGSPIRTSGSRWKRTTRSTGTSASLAEVSVVSRRSRSASLILPRQSSAGRHGSSVESLRRRGPRLGHHQCARH
jgi:urease beta subunit